MKLAGVKAEVNLDITDLKKIVTIMCRNTNCKYHMRPYGIAGCNLKHIVIDDEGKCCNCEVKDV